MFAIGNADEFSSLNGDDSGVDIKSVKKLPNGYLLHHPRIYLTCVDSATMKIDDLAFAIILDALNQEDNDDTETKNLEPEDQP
jgi:hypothetical protein